MLPVFVPMFSCLLGPVTSFLLNHRVHRMETAFSSLDDSVECSFIELWLEIEAVVAFSGSL